MKAYLDLQDSNRIVVEVDCRENLDLLEETSLLSRMAVHDSSLEVEWEREPEINQDNRLFITRFQASLAVGLRTGGATDYALVEALKPLT